MPLHPFAVKALAIREKLGFKDVSLSTPGEARAQVRALWESRGPGEAVHSVVNREIPGPAHPISVRVYRPERVAGVIVFFHGSGFVICDLDTHDAFCRHLANESGCTVVSVDYRLAPEHRYPAAPEDCYAATVWVAEHAAELGAGPGRIATCGDSAGGNLAAVVPLMAKARGGPSIALQLLLYPVLDCSFDSASYREVGQGGNGLTEAAMRWFWGHYLGDDPARGAEPFASPLRAPNLQGLPPALIVTAEYDPLRDEGEAYAARLWEAGVEATCVRYIGMHHAFSGLWENLDAARASISQVAASLHQAFSRIPDGEG